MILYCPDSKLLTSTQHKFMMPCLMDAIFKFHKFGFKTVAVVSDGGSSNLSMMKVLSGATAKAYG